MDYSNDPFAAYQRPVPSADDAFTLLDAAEACAALRLSRSTLQRLVREGKLKRSAVSVGRALFPLSEIHRLIQTPLERAVA